MILCYQCGVDGCVGDRQGISGDQSGVESCSVDLCGIGAEVICYQSTVLPFPMDM